MESAIKHEFKIEIVCSVLKEIEQMDLNADDYYTSDMQKCYHLKKMIEGGLVEGWAKRDGFGNGWSAEIKDITFKGHEFLKLTSNNNVWSEIKRISVVKGIELTIEGVMTIGAKILAQILNGGLL